jgi:hypothetical protein
MAKSASAFSVNDRIKHNVYGLGTIREMDERHTVILFDEAGSKKFVTSMVQLEESDSPTPVKPARATRKKAVKSTTKTTKTAKTAKSR